MGDVALLSSRFLSSVSRVEQPRPSLQVKSMGLTGEYVYLLVKPLELKFFLVHLDRIWWC